jgi:hypothetical protein
MDGRSITIPEDAVVLNDTTEIARLFLNARQRRNADLRCDHAEKAGSLTLVAF